MGLAVAWLPVWKLGWWVGGGGWRDGAGEFGGGCKGARGKQLLQQMRPTGATMQHE